MKNMSLFQMAVLIIFGLFAVIGLILFATFSNKTKEKDIGRVIIWGSIKQDVMNKFLQSLRESDPAYKRVLYKEVPEYKFNEEVTDALAAGEGPDIIILKHEDLLKYKNKIYPISYETFSQRDFIDTFIDGAQIFLAPEGILAIPFAVDPLVLYYNRDIFADNAIVNPPKFWREVPGLAKIMTVRDLANNIKLATISLGAYENVKHAYAILSMLNMQVGSNITSYNPNTGELDSLMLDKAEESSKAVRFFTAFADPVSNIYTWNRSLPNSMDLFVQDSLAMYIGFQSDLQTINNKNPHLNFDLAEIPQVTKTYKGRKARTYGKFWAFAITKGSKNKLGAYRFTINMLNGKYAKMLTDMLGVSYVQKALLAKSADNPLDEIYRRSAIMSYAFLDPNKEKTEEVLQNMVSNIVSGQYSVSQAVNYAGNQIKKIIENYNAKFTK